MKWFGMCSNGSNVSSLNVYVSHITRYWATVGVFLWATIRLTTYSAFVDSLRCEWFRDGVVEGVLSKGWLTESLSLASFLLR